MAPRILEILKQLWAALLREIDAVLPNAPSEAALAMLGGANLSPPKQRGVQK